MKAFARLTWQVPEPASFAASLEARLGAVLEARATGGLVAGARVIDLGSALLEVRPWVREGPADDPRPGGRLMLEPVAGGEEASGATGALSLAGIGWATVELDRAEEELAMWLGEAVTPARAADPHLGARARVRATAGLPGDAFVLLEPHTEGRVAASLARDGEGPCALYLRPAAGLERWTATARATGETLAARRIGPLGAQRLLARGPAAGPHLVLVDVPGASKPRAERGTIAP